MPRKSAAKAPRKSGRIKLAKRASWSTDDVYNLLKAVNEITLRRMENKNDSMNTRMQNNYEFLANTVLPNISNQIRDTNQTVASAWTDIRRVQQDVSAIKTRVGALSGRRRTKTRR
jgi:hypothetical protein